jgi:L-aspartate oxidase
VRHIPNFGQRFPGISELLARYDLDPATDLIPVNPACHYTIGGVVTDACARTNVPALYAVGEVASTGLHGANRLASNSLLEGLVMGEIAGRAAREAALIARASTNGAHPVEQTLPPGWGGWRPPTASAPVPIVSDIRPSDQGELDLADVLSSLRSAMWRNAGIERSGAKLADVMDMIDFWARYTLDKIFDAPDGWQTQNLLLVGAMMARSAHWRCESRGAHWRSDCPEPIESYRAHDHWRRGASQCVTVPVVGGSASDAMPASSQSEQQGAA